MERLALFVEGSTMFYAQQSLGWRIDWRRFLEFFSRGRQCYNAFYYAGVRLPLPEGEESFLRALTNIGYTVRRKPLRRHVDELANTVVERANLELDLVIDLLSTTEQYDTALLAAGSGDLERAMEILRAKGKRVGCVSTFGSIALELRNAVDTYLDLADLRDDLERAGP